MKIPSSSLRTNARAIGLVMMLAFLMVWSVSCAPKRPSTVSIYGVSGAAGATVQAIGNVYDESKKPIAGAMIQIVNTMDHSWNGAATDEQGAFKSVPLKPGRYQFYFEAPGFKSVKSEVVSLATGMQCQVFCTMAKSDEEFFVGCCPKMIDMRSTASEFKVENSEHQLPFY